MKLQEIKDWIKTRKLCTMDEHMKFYCKEAESDYNLLCSIEEVLYSMQEVPVNEDLEEAASRYAKEEYNRKSPATLPDRCKGCYAPLKYAFKAGVKWKEEQLEKNRLALTWEDIEQIYFLVMVEANKLNKHKHDVKEMYQEVLKRFKEYKERKEK